MATIPPFFHNHRLCRMMMSAAYRGRVGVPACRFQDQNYFPSGFSLVEVTLAMGIASFALLVIFSMLPTGMATTQATGRQVAETEIFNRLGSELTATPIYSDPIQHSTNDALYKYSQPAAGRFPAYFDIEGNEVQAGAASIVFTVQCSVETYDNPTAVRKSVWTPTATDNGQGELRWATIRIGFHKNPGTTDNPDPNAAPDRQITKRTFVLANRGT